MVNLRSREGSRECYGGGAAVRICAAGRRRILYDLACPLPIYVRDWGLRLHGTKRVKSKEIFLDPIIIGYNDMRGIL